MSVSWWAPRPDRHALTGGEGARACNGDCRVAAAGARGQLRRRDIDQHRLAGRDVAVGQELWRHVEFRQAGGVGCQPLLGVEQDAVAVGRVCGPGGRVSVGARAREGSLRNPGHPTIGRLLIEVEVAGGAGTGGPLVAVRVRRRREVDRLFEIAAPPHRRLLLEQPHERFGRLRGLGGRMPAGGRAHRLIQIERCRRRSAAAADRLPIHRVAADRGDADADLDSVLVQGGDHLVGAAVRERGANCGAGGECQRDGHHARHHSEPAQQLADGCEAKESAHLSRLRVDAQNGRRMHGSVIWLASPNPTKSGASRATQL